jgi:hypothetical protein
MFSFHPSIEYKGFPINTTNNISNFVDRNLLISPPKEGPSYRF